jgi:hypothetical protein
MGSKNSILPYEVESLHAIFRIVLHEEVAHMEITMIEDVVTRAGFVGLVALRSNLADVFQKAFNSRYEVLETVP